MTFAMALESPTVVAAVIQFLPRGKGALILILGGLAILAFVLVFGRLFAAPRPSPPASRDHDAGMASFVARSRMQQKPALRASSNEGREAQRTDGPSTNDWATGLVHAVGRMRLGRGEVLMADPERCVLSLAECATCRHAGHVPHACEHERTSIQALVASVAPRARVVEIACDVKGRGKCTFEIFRTPNA